MWVTGHLSVGWLIAGRAPGISRACVAWCMFGAIWPDVLDKSLKLWGWTPYGRSVGHALVLWAVAAGVAVLARSRGHMWPWWWVVGWASHLVTDLADDAVAGVLYTGYVFAAWMGWPLWTPDEGQLRVAHVWERCRECVTPLEWMVLGVGVVLMLYRCKHARKVGADVI